MKESKTAMFTPKTVYCQLVKTHVRQDILCLVCKKCKLDLDQISKKNHVINKYLSGGFDNE